MLEPYNTQQADALRKEIQLLQVLYLLRSEEFQNELDEWCADYRVTIDEHAQTLTLTEDETDQEIALKNDTITKFFKVHKVAEHWINKYFIFSAKELLLILFKTSPKHIIHLSL